MLVGHHIKICNYTLNKFLLVHRFPIQYLKDSKAIQKRHVNVNIRDWITFGITYEHFPLPATTYTIYMQSRHHILSSDSERDYKMAL